MPGRLRASFRSGNLAEHLGLLLLKGIAAVAEVARPEDVGLGAVATLLRRADDGNCYAEDSFVVQLKSASATTIEYQDHELDWFVGQSQPMFIGLVSLDSAQISLYPTLFVNHAVLSLHATKVTVCFGTSDLPPFLYGQKCSAWKGEPDDGATVWLGEPLLQWTLDDLVDQEWAERTYSILKSFLAVAQREIDLLSFGQCSVLSWSTNDLSSIKTQSGMIKGHPDDLKLLADRCTPGLNAIMLHAMSMRDDSGQPVMVSLIALAAALKDIGVEIDPDNLFGKFFCALQQREGNNAT
ncbi:MAG: hypothetical protein ACR2GY_00275 [Phycisphaerales bacterium]